MTTTRTRILTAVHEQLRLGGYHALSISAVGRAAGATTGSIYHFFPGGKSELVAAAVRDAGDAYRLLAEAVLAEWSTAADGIEAFFSAAADALADADYADICPVGAVARETAAEDEALRASARIVFESWSDTIVSRLLSDGIGHGDAERLADLAICALEGGFMLARTRRSSAPLRNSGALVAAAVREASAGRANTPAPS